MYDAIIIGAGMSGLAAGLRLAMFDQKVCVLERHYAVGGLNGFYRLRGRAHDVGLHAVTNFTRRGAKRGPLARLLKQLRIDWGEFGLREQLGSEVAFPGERLRFSNDFALFESEVRRAFPHQIDRFRAMIDRLCPYDDLDQSMFGQSARAFLAETLDDPLLIEMILCPIMWYGNGRENDIDLGLFCILFRSIFQEGFARPREGIRQILRLLSKRFRDAGGELRMMAGVKSIETDGDRAVGVTLDDGEELTARQVISSAGRIETMRICNDAPAIAAEEIGQLSFVETIACLNKPPKDVGCDRTIIFYNDSPRMPWHKPDDFCDLRTGVVCSPNNYDYSEEDGPAPEGMVRVTVPASYAKWTSLGEEEYRQAKADWFPKITESALRFTGDFRSATVDTDMYTPHTLYRYTWHENGTVYGSPRKQLDGGTHLENLHLCGTDQGFLGIIGAMVGGIAIANKCLQISLAQ